MYSVHLEMCKETFCLHVLKCAPGIRLVTVSWTQPTSDVSFHNVTQEEGGFFSFLSSTAISGVLISAAAMCATTGVSEFLYFS